MIDVVCGLPSAPRYKTLPADGSQPADTDIDTEFHAPEGLFQYWASHYHGTATDLESRWMKGSPLNASDRAQVQSTQPPKRSRIS